MSTPRYSKETVEWLTTVPASDQNFKSHLATATLADCEEALKWELKKTALVAIETRMKQLFRESKNAKALVVQKGGRQIASLAEFENLGPVPAGPQDRFALVNRFHDLARLSMAQSCAYMILTGVELLALKKDAEHGTWEKLFADHRSGKSRNDSTFAFSYDTARNYTRLAEAAKKNVPALQELCSGLTPLSQMDEAHREAIIAAVRKAGDGSTYQELALEWGLVKQPRMLGGDTTPKDGTKRARASKAETAQAHFCELQELLFRGISPASIALLPHLPAMTDEPDQVASLTHLIEFTGTLRTAAQDALKIVKGRA